MDAVASALQRCAASMGGRVRQTDRGRLTADEALALMDLLLCHAATLDEGLHQWARHFPLLGQPWEVQIRRESASLVLLPLTQLPAAAGLPEWLGYLCLALHARLLQFSGGTVRWQLKAPAGHLPELAVSPPLRLRQAPLLTWVFSPLLLGDACQVRPVIPVTLLALLGQRLLDELPPRALLQDRVRFLLRDALPEVPSERAVAEQLGVSVRAVQRQLAAHNTSFGALLAEVRHARALVELAHPHTPLPTVAARVGFVEQSSFQRAFRRWQGVTPGQYRRQLQHHHTHSVLPAIRLHHAVNLLQTEQPHDRRGAEVWALIVNRAFEKRVEVLCIDTDGIRRAYPATFVRFVGPGRELWRTANLPVAEPLTFSVRYHVGGEHFVDDDGGHPYIVTRQAGAVLGEPALVYRRGMAHNRWDGTFQWLAEVLTRPSPGMHLVAEITAADGHCQRVDAHLLRLSDGAAWWGVSAVVSDGRVRFVLTTESGEDIDDNAGAGYPLNWE